MIDYTPCNLWVERDKEDGFFIQVWATSDANEIKRVDMVNETDGHHEAWNFYEIDDAAQDPSVFKPETFIVQNCNSFSAPANFPRRKLF